MCEGAARGPGWRRAPFEWCRAPLVLLQLARDTLRKTHAPATHIHPHNTTQHTPTQQCGVRLLRTNLMEADVEPVKEALTQALFDHIPVGVGSQGIIPTTAAGLEAALEMGMDWSLR